jgi:ERCC4-type nuclease
MDFIIDNRELYLLDYFKSQDINFSSSSLNLGDFLFEDKNQTLLIERKTWNDLHASIMDGRFREQRSRLLSWRTENKKIMYIIEGKRTQYEKEYWTVVRLMLSYDIPVFFTENIEATGKFLTDIHEKKSLENIIKPRTVECDQVESRVKALQKKNYTSAKLFFDTMLVSIKGISYNMIKNLPFMSFYDFFHQYHTNLEKWNESLYNAKYTTASGKESTIKPTVIKKILENLGIQSLE